MSCSLLSLRASIRSSASSQRWGKGWPSTFGSEWPRQTSGVMIELAQRDSHLAGKIDQRDGESAQRNHEEDGDPALMLELKERGYKRYDNKKCHRNTGDHGPEDGSVHHRRPPRQARKIGFEAGSDSIAIRNPVQEYRSIDNPVQAGNQDGNKRSQRAEKERGRCRLRND